MLCICPVCGYDNLEQPPFSSSGFPTYETCSCCGFEFGFTDESEKWTYEAYRERWIQEGCFFKYAPDRPKNWSVEQAMLQLHNLERVKHFVPRK
ncbi:MAG: hypothetical protein IPM49_06430 [Flavobacteriales bacterium]|nr:hypothetical protein [Flavobacteriales bacterium]